jgi:hypothetical protein
MLKSFNGQQVKKSYIALIREELISSVAFSSFTIQLLFQHSFKPFLVHSLQAYRCAFLPTARPGLKGSHDL